MRERRVQDPMWKLFSDACDGQLSDADVAHLQSLLQSPIQRRRFVEYCQMHADLHFRIRGDHAEKRGVAQAFALELSESESFGTDLLVSELVTARMAAMSQWALRPALAAAVLILVLLGVWIYRNDTNELVAERESQPIASLTHFAEAQWQAGFVPNEGERLTEGQSLSLVSGRAQVSMSCGAELVLKGPCSIVMTAPDQVLLRDGLISVQIADWTEGFTIKTPSVHIVDLGKQFVVSADPITGNVEAHAIDGKLRVRAVESSSAKGKDLFVASGEAIRVTPVSNRSMRLPADDALFDRGIEASSPFKPLVLHNTGRGLALGDSDPHWRITSASADDIQVPCPARVCNHHEGAYLPNDENASQWISIDHPLDNNSPPFAMYTFETEVDLSGYDLSTVTLVAQVIADNGVSSIRINGKAVAFKPWMYTGYQFRTFRNIEIADGFVEGINKIEFDVWNGPYENSHDAYNPMAFRVEWQAFGRLKRSSVQVLPMEASIGAGTRIDRLARVDRGDLSSWVLGRNK